MKFLRSSIFVLLLLAIFPGLLLAGEKDKKKAAEPFCSLSVLVLKESSGKPVKNASVVIHLMRKDGTPETDGFQLKTDAEGKAHLEDLPYGKVQIQAIAPGTQTYGDDLELNQPQQQVVIRLKPPAGQISIYK